MSYLSVPQINFQGTAYCNPSTGDNNDFANIFDVDTLQLAPIMTVIDPGTVVVLDPPGEQSFTYQGVQSASGCRAWLMGLMNNVSDGGPYGQQSHWNYYGDHGTRLDNTSVTTLVGSDGTQFPSSDPLYNATISLIGTPSPMQFQDPVIVDNDPYALITSQIFSHGISVIAPDKTSLISASVTARSYAYYINVSKNLDPNAIGFQMVSAIFITSVPNGPDLVINTNAGSPALNDLATAAAAGAGLQLRFIFYNAIYQIQPHDLWQMFQAKNYAPNPYIGKTMGTIGVLAPGDLLSAPPGRKLNVQSSFSYLPSAPCAPATGSNTQTASLGITLANIDAATETVYLDCIGTFPECNVQSDTKFNFGSQPINLVLTPDGGGQPITLGAIPNTQAQYEASSGMVAIPLSSHPQLAAIKASIASGTLSIYDENSQTTLLTESAGIDIQTEDRAVYFDVQTIQNWSNPNEQPQPGTATITLQVFSRGVPVQQAVQVNIEHWMCAKDQINPSKPQVPVPSRYFSISGAVAQTDTQYTNAPGNPGTIQVITDQVTIPANSNGQITLTLSGLRPGTSIIRFVDPTIPSVPPNFVWDNTDYSCIRILPFDDYRTYTDEQIDNWPFMYENFFNYFALLYPVMSHVIPWGPTDAPDNPDMVAQFASQIKIFTNPSNWDSTIYMPITRDLSAGKRELLWRWCNLQTN
jgi:hypothetical protein